MEYRRIKKLRDAVVVAFDICSSSDVIEELILKDDIQRFQGFLGKIKEYMADLQKGILFEPYKFTGDGWILLFPKDSNGTALLAFLRDLCVFFKREFGKDILPYLDTPPSITGLSFGLEHGRIAPMTIFGETEYIGRALNVACRLQSAVKAGDGSPAYKALVSNTVFNLYLSPATGYEVSEANRNLRNIRGGKDFRCREISLLNASSMT